MNIDFDDGDDGLDCCRGILVALLLAGWVVFVAVLMWKIVRGGL